MACQALKSNGISLDKGRVLWTLRQLCGRNETLPKSYVLPIEFKPSGPFWATGGFADIFGGNYEGREVAFKFIRATTQTDELSRSRRKVRYDTFPPAGDVTHLITSVVSEAVLQRGGIMEIFASPEHIGTHWGVSFGTRA